MPRLNFPLGALACVALIASLPGCATFSADGGRAAVSKLVQERGGQVPQITARDEQVSALLRQPQAVRAVGFGDGTGLAVEQSGKDQRPAVTTVIDAFVQSVPVSDSAG